MPGQAGPVLDDDGGVAGDRVQVGVADGPQIPRGDRCQSDQVPAARGRGGDPAPRLAVPVQGQGLVVPQQPTAQASQPDTAATSVSRLTAAGSRGRMRAQEEPSQCSISAVPLNAFMPR